jgi:hypothetical protein
MTKKILKFCCVIAAGIFFGNCNTNENTNGQTSPRGNSTGQQLGDLPMGFTNLGNTCFANSTLVLLFASDQIKQILNDKLIAIAGQAQNQIDAREAFKKSLKNLYDARDNKKPDLKPELNACFDAFEKARLAVLGSGLVGGLLGGAKLRKDQGDSRDFLNDILVLLGYGNDPNVAFKYAVFRGAPLIKILPSEEPSIGFTMAGLDASKTYEIKNLYDTWVKPQAMINGDQLYRVDPNPALGIPGLKADSDVYHVIKNPPLGSIFFVALRYLPGTPPARLSTVVKPSLSLTIISKNRDVADLNKEFKHNYDFTAMAVQSGDLNCGHYYSYVYDKPNQRFIKFNDASVSIVTEAEMMADASNGYLYLYQKSINP